MHVPLEETTDLPQTKSFTNAHFILFIYSSICFLVSHFQ